MNSFLSKSLGRSFLLVLWFILASFTSHKYYFSFTDIEVNEKNNSLEIITNVFIDDIELEMNKLYNVKLNLSLENQHPKTDSIFGDYFEKNLTIKVDSETTAFKYLGIEFEADLVYVYMEASNVLEPTEFAVTNTILLNEFEDQQNVVKIKKNRVRKSDILTKKNVKTLLKF